MISFSQLQKVPVLDAKPDSWMSVLVDKPLSFGHKMLLRVNSEDPDQTGRMHQTGRMLRLIGVFTGLTSRFVGFVVQRLK